jgi:hypothetical protein
VFCLFVQEVGGKVAIAFCKEQSTKFNALPRAAEAGPAQLQTNVSRDPRPLTERAFCVIRRRLIRSDRILMQAGHDCILDILHDR